MFVSAVPVHNHNLLAAIARHLVCRFLQEIELYMHAVGHSPRLLPRFGDLSEIIRGEDQRVLLLCGMLDRVAHIDQIGAIWESTAIFALHRPLCVSTFLTCVFHPCLPWRCGDTVRRAALSTNRLDPGFSLLHRDCLALDCLFHETLRLFAHLLFRLAYL